jgi:hypothetical protein
MAKFRILPVNGAEIFADDIERDGLDLFVTSNYMSVCVAIDYLRSGAVKSFEMTTQGALLKMDTNNVKAILTEEEER